MSDRTELEIYSLLPAHSHGAYTLMLSEKDGARKLPILIGAFEAQAIAIELEDMRPSRPLTHDLFVNFMNIFNFNVSEVVINDFSEGVYYSEIVCELNGRHERIDSRTSDAIALAAKLKCPIYAYEKVMSEVSYEFNEEEKEVDSPGRLSHEELIPVSKSTSGFEKYSMEELETLLEEVIAMEDYARAVKIRDEIAKRNKK